MSVPANLRRVLASWAAALWILGFEVAPNVHLGLHGVIAAHSHGGARSDDRGHDHDHDHDHGDADHHADAPADEPGASAPAQGRAIAKRADLQHGAHDLLHRGIAIAVPPVAMPGVADAPLVDADLFELSSDAIVERAAVQSRARGPPVAGDVSYVASV